MDLDDDVLQTDADEGIWSYSDSASEEFDEADMDQDYTVDVVGEEIRNGELRHEVVWHGWQRGDGTSNTWKDEVDVEEWNEDAAKRRKKLAQESMDIQIWTDLNVVDTNTRLRAQAYDEKRRKRTEEPVTLAQQMQANLIKHGKATPAPAPAPRRAPQTARRGRPTVGVPSSATGRDRNTPEGGPSTSRATRTPQAQPRSHAPSPPSTDYMDVDSEEETAPRPRPSRKGKGKERVVYSPPPSPPRSSSSKGKEKVLSTPTQITMLTVHQSFDHIQETLSAEWTARAGRKGAAAITFVNDLDSEEIPALDSDFEYLENEFDYTAIKHEVPDPKWLFVYCEDRRCTDYDECNCLYNQEEKACAYDKSGRFIDNSEESDSPALVIECNAHCACDENCRNRVAQLPRKIPIEVFKTEKCGWGVRSPVDVKKGTVLGLYTGKIIDRDNAEVLKGEKKNYCFDMDGREDPEDPPDNSYTVDARTCGNWTRFLNHSCSANLKVYLAIWLTIPESNLPSLVYYATKDIRAGTEFTFDYDPRQAKLFKEKEKKGKKGKGKIKIPKGAIECECGTEACRGWVTVNC
ncbi:hypothetical protein V5O48_008026 [Marasmius crinis-equi]|uniref:SET domain-containing protein n=1 Tax=Marasmius crinis-equi TaxID=585013 RepID=A0ABR3FF84_9AGAR